MSNESKLLKTLLLKEELETLELLKSKLLDDEQFTHEVSIVLANAVKSSQDLNQDLEKTLEKPINDGILRAFTENKETIIDSMLPIMGKLIRQTVSNSIKQFATDINRTLELGFSAKALKWRWQAFQTDQSFAEIVYQKTIKYEVQEIFLIHKETGLLIEHAGTQELLKNKDAISAMLTVIQDYIGDSLNTEDSELQSAEVGENLFWITSGTHAYLASVVKGNPTNRLKEKLQDLVETVHASHSEDIVSQNDFGNIPELHKQLEAGLTAKTLEEESEKSINWWPWIIALALLISFFGYRFYQNHTQKNLILETLNATPGTSLISLTKSSGDYQVNILKDPLADTSVLESIEDIQISSETFLSLDDEIINRRINLKITNSPELLANFSQGVVTLDGWIDFSQLDETISNIEQIVGVTKIIQNFNTDFSRALRDDIDNCCANIKELKTDITRKRLELSGNIKETDFDQIQQLLKTKYQGVELNYPNLNILDSKENLIKSIESNVINLPSFSSEQTSAVNVDSLVKDLKALIRKQENVVLDVKGFSDCDSPSSDFASQKRATTIKSILVNSGVPDRSLSISINSCNSTNNQPNPAQRQIKFKVLK